MKNFIILLYIFINVVAKQHTTTKPVRRLISKVSYRSKSLPRCNEDQLMINLAEIQVINPENIINLSAFQDVQTLCNNVANSLNTMDNYLESCEPPQQKDLYIQLIKGVDSLYNKLCTPNSFQTKFKKHYKCFHDLHNDFQDCSGPADWTENSQDTKVCKAYYDIVDCYYVKTAKLCGKNAAELMKQLVLAVIDSVLVIKCEIKLNCFVSDAMPDDFKNSSSRILLSCVWYLFIFYGTCFLCSILKMYVHLLM